MKVHRVRLVDIVREPDDSFASLLHNKRRTWRDSVVAKERCITLVGVDTLCQWLNVDLIVVNGLVRDWVGDSPGEFLVNICFSYKTRVNVTYILGVLTGGSGRGNWYRKVYSGLSQSFLFSRTETESVSCGRGSR